MVKIFGSLILGLTLCLAPSVFAQFFPTTLVISKQIDSVFHLGNTTTLSFNVQNAVSSPNLIFPITTSITPSLSTRPLIGVNIHTGGGNATDNQKIADFMSLRNFKSARMDFWSGIDVVNFRDQVVKLKAKGIKTEVVLQNSYQWDHSCNQNLAMVETDSYNQTITLVNSIKDIVFDFELLNEVNLRPELQMEIATGNFSPISAYANKPCYATMAKVLKGMSRAIVDIRTSTGASLNIILGTTGNDYAFLDFMAQQGVTFDIVGYHVYPHFYQALLSQDPWYGTGGIVGQLGRFGKPVRINEFNCGEIYDVTYENKVGQPSTNTCLKSINKHLTELLKQATAMNLQSVIVYEILDEPTKLIPENRFGIMYDLDTQKLHAALYSAFAGGYVSLTEKIHLIFLGIKSQ